MKMTANRRIFLNIAATYARSLYTLALGLVTARWLLLSLGQTDYGLFGVVGGLVDVPVIAVPTSVGYGASFEGLSALLAMLNSCASGVSVVNIDNGFGAGFIASRINTMGEHS